MDNHLVELGGEWQEPCLRKMLWVTADISAERATPIAVHSAPAHGPAPSMITSEAGAEEYLFPQRCSGVQGLCQDSSDKHLSDSTFHCYMSPPHSQKEKVSNPGNCFPMHFWGSRPGRHVVCPLNYHRWQSHKKFPVLCLLNDTLWIWAASSEIHI